jgi:hypothetical protein
MDALFNYVYWAVIAIAASATIGVSIIVLITAYRVYLEAKEDKRNGAR